MRRLLPNTTVLFVAGCVVCSVLSMARAQTDTPTATPTLTPTPVESRKLLKCQKQLERQIRSFTRQVGSKVHACTEKVVRCKLAFEIDNEDPATCLAGAKVTCDKVAAVDKGIPAKLSKAKAKVNAACEQIPLAAVEGFVAGLGFFNIAAECAALQPPLTPISVSAVSDLVDCSFATARCAAEREVFIRDPRSGDSLADPAIDLASDFPCVGPPPTPTPTTTPSETPTETPTPL
jgi:hypothetical protein